MAEFKSFSSGVEVTGEVLMAFLAGFPQEFRSSGLLILDKHGLSDPKPKNFYPLQRFLDAMKEMSDTFSRKCFIASGNRLPFMRYYLPE